MPGRAHHEEQIHIVEPEALEALVEPQLHARVVRGPDLADDEDVLAAQTGIERRP